MILLTSASAMSSHARTPLPRRSWPGDKPEMRRLLRVHTRLAASSPEISRNKVPSGRCRQHPSATHAPSPRAPRRVCTPAPTWCAEDANMGTARARDEAVAATFRGCLAAGRGDRFCSVDSEPEGDFSPDFPACPSRGSSGGVGHPK